MNKLTCGCEYVDSLILTYCDLHQHPGPESHKDGKGIIIRDLEAQIEERGKDYATALYDHNKCVEGLDLQVSELKDQARVAGNKWQDALFMREELQDAAELGAKWMEAWLQNQECDCEAGHICGRQDRLLELERIRQVIAKSHEDVIVKPKEDSNDECECTHARGIHGMSGKGHGPCMADSGEDAFVPICSCEDFRLKRNPDRDSICVHCDIHVPMHLPCPKCGRGGEKPKEVTHHEYCDTLDVMIKGKPCNCPEGGGREKRKAHSSVCECRECKGWDANLG